MRPPSLTDNSLYIPSDISFFAVASFNVDRNNAINTSPKGNLSGHHTPSNPWLMDSIMNLLNQYFLGV